ncbi:alpha/beta hydrolase [Roseimaritima ulvae]|nr:alpha/beta hydrolase [Roseimaritima ulvae]
MSTFHPIFAACLIGTFLFSASAAAEPESMPLWSGDAPGETAELGPERTQPLRNEKPTPIIRLTDVTKPMITVYRPEKQDPARSVVIVAPGGGYNILAYNHEGSEICEWLNSIGVTAVLLKYRVPRRPDVEPHAVPLLDAQRAVRTVRANAEKWNIDSDKIGMLGFSAGGHLTVMTGVHGDDTVAQPADDIDKQSARINFMIPIYPAYLLNKETQQLETSIKVDKDFPPAFIAITYDDAERAVGAAQLLIAMKSVNVPCELHVYRNGGHGYGMRPTGNAVAQWPKLCQDWMLASGLLTK